LAPVIEDEKLEVEDDGEPWTVVNRRRDKGKGKATHATPEEDAQPTLREDGPSQPAVTRKRGRRGHGRRGRSHEEALT